MSSMDVLAIQGVLKWPLPWGISLEFCSTFHMDVCGMCIWLTKKEMENFIEKTI
jgi:hypothetical protein